jgi:integrase
MRSRFARWRKPFDAAHLVRRKSSGALTITGTVAGRRIRRRAQSDDPKLAEEEAAALEAELLRTAWHRERRASRTFAEAALSYLEAAPRSVHTNDYVRRILLGLGGEARLGQVDQDAATRLRRTLLKPDAKPSTYLRQIVTPLRAILRHAADRGWCNTPRIATPKTPGGRTRYLLPGEAERLIAVAAPHLRPLVAFLIGTGARMAEAVYLDWRDVDLTGGRAIFWANRPKQANAAMLRCPRAWSPRSQTCHTAKVQCSFRIRAGPTLIGAAPMVDRSRRAGMARSDALASTLS